MDFTPTSHVTQNWQLAKPAASGRRGVVVSQCRNASEAGVAVLDAGGNAIDAAVATALALAALEAKRFTLTGRIAADLFAWPEVEGDANIHGPLSFVIPSAVAGLAEMHGRWGRLPLSVVAAPSIALAKRGLPLDWYTTLKVAVSASVLRKYPESAGIYLPGGLPPVPPYQGGLSYFRLGRLSETLDRLARAGWHDFYRGDIAASIIADTRAMGGLI